MKNHDHTELRRISLFLLLLAAFLVTLDFTYRVGNDYISTGPKPGRKALVEASSRVRDDLNRAMDLLERCFGRPVNLDKVRSVPVTLTAYTSTEQECDSTPHITASQHPVRRGTIAVSADLMEEMGLAFGQKVLIPGYGIYEVQDRMNSRWRRKVDIWYDDREAALLFGRQEGTIIWVSPAEKTASASPVVATTLN